MAEWSKIHLETSLIDVSTKESITGDKTKVLTEQELDLLLYFVNNAEKVISREELFKEVWGYSEKVNSRTVDQMVKQLRKKIGENASKPKHLFSVYGKGYRFQLPPQPEPEKKEAPNNIGSTEDMIGRDDELKTLMHLFENNAQIVTILGPGGMGKTTLSKSYGVKAVDSDLFPDGVWFCDLAEARNELDIIQAVTEITGIKIPNIPDMTELSSEVGRALNQLGDMLLILDNFEQIVECAGGTIGVWLRFAKRIRYIITSRQRIGFLQENVIELVPLSEDDGIDLFVQRAKILRVGFEPDPKTKHSIRNIVNHLDRIPLAILLAASRTRLMNVQQIEARLSNRFKLLRRGTNMSSKRQSTMRAAIDWSWEMLTAEERSTLEQCSVFRGGFDLGAAEEVIDLSEFDDVFLEDVLQSLVDKSLVHIQTVEAAQSNPIKTYDTIRYYALEKLEKTGNLDNTRSRHVDYFVEWSKSLINVLKDAKKEGSFDEEFNQMGLEVDNLQSAFFLAIDKNSNQAALDILNGIGIIFDLRGWNQSLLDITAPLVGRSDLREEDRANLHYRRGRAHYWIGEMEKARSDFEITAKLGTGELKGSGISSLYNVQQRTGEMEEAAKTLDLYEAHASPEHRDYVHNLRGSLFQNQCRYDEAVKTYKSGLQLAMKHKHFLQEAMILNGLGSCHISMGSLEKAEEYLKRAMEINIRYSNQIQRSLNLINLGNIFIRKKQPEQALDQLQRSRSLLLETGDQRFLLINNFFLAVAHRLKGEMEKSTELLEENADKEEPESSPNFALSQSILAGIKFMNGEMEEAMTLWQSATAMLEKEPPHSAENWKKLADAYIELNKVKDLNRTDLNRSRTIRATDRLLKQKEFQLPEALEEQPEHPDPLQRHQFHVLILSKISEEFKAADRRK